MFARTRTRIVPQDTTITNYEIAWDTSTTPYQRKTTGTTTYDSTSSNHSISWLATLGPTYPLHREVIEDQWNQYTGKSFFSPCKHTIETNRFNAPWLPLRGIQACLSNTYVRNLSGNAIAAALALIPEPDIDWNTMAEQAVAFMMPRLNEGTSLVNFVLELKDLKRMNPIGSLKRIKSRNLTMRQLNDNPRLRKKFLKELGTRITGGHLNAEFGVKPLVGDLAQMWDELISLQGKLERLRRFTGLLQTRRYRRYLLDADGNRTSTNWVEPLTFTLVNWSTNVRNDTMRSSGVREPNYTTPKAQWIQRPIYHATMRYYYTLPLMSRAEEQVKARLDNLGLRVDPSIIWNAIPFSFLVDWVVDVSAFLRSFSRDNWPISTTISEFCHSLTWSARYDSDLWVHDQFSSTADDPTRGKHDPFFKTVVSGSKGRFPVWTGYRSYYDRRVPNELALDTHSIAARSIDLRKAALAASLLYSFKKGLNSSAYLHSLPTKKRK